MSTTLNRKAKGKANVWLWIGGIFLILAGLSGLGQFPAMLAAPLVVAAGALLLPPVWTAIAGKRPAIAAHSTLIRATACVGAVIFFGALLPAGSLTTSSSGVSEASSEPRSRQGTRVATAGDETRLRSKSGGSVPVAASRAALKKFQELAVADDSFGMSQMVVAGDVWSVPSGTKVLVIDPGALSYEVRILEGSDAGRSCFVVRNVVSKIRE